MQYTLLGLGNPDEKYQGTRHNIGRAVLDRVHERYGTTDWHLQKSQVWKAKAAVDSHTLVLLKPDTYMNKSGAAVAALKGKQKSIERLIILHDDMDLPLGSVRIVRSRGNGGHNGVASVERTLRSRDYTRVRLGVAPTTPRGTIKKPVGEDAVISFLLSQFARKESGQVEALIELGTQAVHDIVVHGCTYAMNTHN